MSHACRASWTRTTNNNSNALPLGGTASALRIAAPVPVDVLTTPRAKTERRSRHFQPHLPPLPLREGRKEGRTSRSICFERASTVLLGSTNPKRLITRVVVSFAVKNIYSRRNGRLRFALLHSASIVACENLTVNHSRGFASANILYISYSIVRYGSLDIGDKWRRMKALCYRSEYETRCRTPCSRETKFLDALSVA